MRKDKYRLSFYRAAEILVSSTFAGIVGAFIYTAYMEPDATVTVKCEPPKAPVIAVRLKPNAEWGNEAAKIRVKNISESATAEIGISYARSWIERKP